MQADYFSGEDAKVFDRKSDEFSEKNQLSMANGAEAFFLGGTLTDDIVRPSPRASVYSDQPFGYFLLPFHVLIEIYPLVPSPPSACEEEPVYTSRVRGWGPVTSARTFTSRGVRVRGGVEARGQARGTRGLTGDRG